MNSSLNPIAFAMRHAVRDTGGFLSKLPFEGGAFRPLQVILEVRASVMTLEKDSAL